MRENKFSYIQQNNNNKMSGSNLSGSDVFTNHNRWTVLMLKTRLRELGVRFLSKDRKSQLISLLQNYDAVNSASTQSLEDPPEQEEEDQDPPEQEELDNDEEEEEDQEEEEEEEEEEDEFPEVDEEVLQFLFTRQMKQAGFRSDQIVDFLDAVF